MGLHKFLMKHGVGSAGYIAGKLASAYRLRRAYTPWGDERAILRSIFVERIAAQTAMGGPPQYHLLRTNSEAIEELLDHHADLYSVVLLSIFIEHPELTGPGSRRDTFEVLEQAVQETLDQKIPGWRTSGIWSERDLSCSACKQRIDYPDAARMYAAINQVGIVEYTCIGCTLPIQMHAMSDLGFFMGERFKQRSDGRY